jgi:DNA-binding CsgD family transcriptional regulator
MDVRRLTRRGGALCQELAEGHDALPEVLGLLADCIGTDLVSCATFEAGSTLFVPGAEHPLLVLHGCAPLSETMLTTWDRLLPSHPYAAHLASAPTPSPRLTDVVDLPTLEGTELFELCLRPHGARYQCGLTLDRAPGRLVLLSLWRDDSDFDDPTVEVLQLFARAVGAAMQVGANLEALRQLSGITIGAEILSPRQQQVASMVALGLTNEQIARRLGLTTRTVRKHIEDAFARTGARSRTELAVRWRQGASCVESLTVSG